MIKNKPITIIVAFLLAFVLNSPAQIPVSLAGPDGIFTQFGTAIPDTFEYRLYRLESGSEEKPVLVSTGEKPLSYEILKTRFLNINAKNPIYRLPVDSIVQKLFVALTNYSTVDSIPVYNGIPQFIEAAGLGYYDKSVLPGKQYTYRVAVFDKKGHLLKSSTTNPVSAPGVIPEFGIKFLNAITSNDEITLNYSCDNINRPFDIKIYRQAYLQTGFREVFPQKFFYSENDSSFFWITDKHVVKGVIYRYAIIPFDLLGNAAPCPDTVKISCDRESILNPEILKFKAESNNEKRAINLKWEISGSEGIQSISIFRSEQFDDNYTIISRLPGSETSFSDHNIEPLKSYYYYMVLHGVNIDYPKSATVIGMLEKSGGIVLPPVKLSIEQTSEGNLVTWQKSGAGTKGYFVYRGIGYGSEMVQISTFIAESGQTGNYLDPFQNLSPGVAYSYAVAAVNAGNSIGQRTEQAFSEPFITDLPAPTNFYINRQENSAFLVWDAMANRVPYISGYNIYRSDNGNDPVKLNSLPLPYEQNTYRDTNLVRGIKYVYTVTSAGPGNTESPSSLSFDFELPELLPQPPAGIRLTKTTDGGILSWDTPAIDNIRAFCIYRENSEVGKPEKIAEVPVETTEFEITSGSPGMYFFTVSVVNAKGIESKRSGEVWLHMEE